MIVTHTLGIGDYLALESALHPEERAAITHVVWGPQAGPTMAPLCRLCPPLAHWSHDVLQVQPEHEDVNTSLFRYFGLIPYRAHTGSSFLKYPMADISGLDLPDSYYVIQPSTPVRTEDQRKHRDFDVADWDTVIARLQHEGQYGLVLNAAGAEPAPDHPLIVDFQGQTSLGETIEALKSPKCRGFLGIDSCLSILSAQLFEADRLWVRTRNRYLLAMKHKYYAPHKDCPFLHSDNLKPVPLPTGPLRMVQFLTCALVGSRVYLPGETEAINLQRAERLIKGGEAREYRDPYALDSVCN